MGFQVGRVFELDFADTDAAGAIVKVRSCSIGTLRGIETVDDEIREFADHVVEWNLEDSEGVPIPTTFDGMLMLEEPFKNLLIREWMKATRGISRPFDHRSDDGEPSPTGDEPAPSIPMEPL
jgi:hypothetical protein